MTLLNFDEFLKARTHRILKRFGGYLDLTESSDDSARKQVASLHDNEQIIGIYFNAPDDLQTGIIVTLRGLHIYRNGWQCIEYGQIARIFNDCSGDTAKLTVEDIQIEITPEEIVTIKITGGEGRSRDYWGFYRFLSRIAEDYRKRHACQN